MRLKVVCLFAVLFLGVTSEVALTSHAFGPGGGSSEQHAPDTTKAGAPTVVRFIVGVWGSGGAIKGRFTNIVLHYRLESETTYEATQAKLVALPENYMKVASGINQWEAYEFTIPPYPNDTNGRIEYYIEMTFDGNISRVNGTKKIKILSFQ